jgi:hypothetical protein
MQQTLQFEAELLPSFIEISSTALPTLGASIPVTCMQRIITRDASGASSISEFQAPVQARMLYPNSYYSLKLAAQFTAQI